ncbi:MAG: hypothetical protein DMG35_20755 [Acidobacteria bacterium]|nr:MAG: hypothetical protein DMG35_20755 [Acidobacteriota bacterium]
MKISGKFVWSSTSAKVLCESLGCTDPLEAIRLRSLRLIEKAGIERPPFSPYVLGLRLGINRVVFSPIGFDACLLPTTSGYEVQICSEHSRIRQNFSMAHEIGHVFFFEATGKSAIAKREKRIGMNGPDREEEFLCDYAASELIMPSFRFFRDVRYFGPSLGSIFELAKRYRASLRATTIKFAEMGLWKCAFVFWRLIGAGSDADFQLESCTRFGGLRLADHEGISIPKKHLLAAVESGRTVRGRELVQMGQLKDTYYIESVRIGSKSSSRVLSMIFADMDAEHLAYASRQYLAQPTNQKQLFEEND